MEKRIDVILGPTPENVICRGLCPHNPNTRSLATIRTEALLNEFDIPCADNATGQLSCEGPFVSTANFNVSALCRVAVSGFLYDGDREIEPFDIRDLLQIDVDEEAA